MDRNKGRQTERKADKRERTIRWEREKGRRIERKADGQREREMDREKNKKFE